MMLVMLLCYGRCTVRFTPTCRRRTSVRPMPPPSSSPPSSRIRPTRSLPASHHPPLSPLHTLLHHLPLYPPCNFQPHRVYETDHVCSADGWIGWMWRMMMNDRRSAAATWRLCQSPRARATLPKERPRASLDSAAFPPPLPSPPLLPLFFSFPILFPLLDLFSVLKTNLTTLVASTKRTECAPMKKTKQTNNQPRSKKNRPRLSHQTEKKRRVCCSYHSALWVAAASMKI